MQNSEDEGCDDSPHVTALILTTENSAYQQVLDWIQKDQVQEHFNVDIVYEAFCNIIECEDNEKANALDYFLSSSLPSRFLNNKDPLGVLIAKQPDHPQLYDMLMVLKMYNPDMLD